MSELNPSLSVQSTLSLVQATLRQVFASGVIIPVDEEVEIRASLADMLMQEYERSRRQQDLHGAIDHNETIPASPATFFSRATRAPGLSIIRVHVGVRFFELAARFGRGCPLR